MCDHQDIRSGCLDLYLNGVVIAQMSCLDAIPVTRHEGCGGRYEEQANTHVCLGVQFLDSGLVRQNSVSNQTLLASRGA